MCLLLFAALLCLLVLWHMDVGWCSEVRDKQQ